MKILLIIEGTYPWYRGGVSEWVYQYVAHLTDFEFTILQIATDEFQGLDPKNALYPLTSNIQNFIRVSPPDFSTNSTGNLDDWRKGIKGALSELQHFDLLHVTNTGFAGWLAAQISEEQETPLLLTEHAIYWKEVEMGASALECGYQIPESDIAKEETVSLFKHLARLTYTTAKQVVTVSKINIPEQAKLGAKDIQYIPNGIPSSWLKEEETKTDNLHIGWVGRCAEMKNPLAFFDYMDAFEAYDYEPNFSMLLCDANEPKLKQKVLLKAKKYPEVDLIWNEPAEKYFQEFDFLLITSHNESQPLVMLEALANRALPVGYQVGDFDQNFGLAFDADILIEDQVQMIMELWNDKEQFQNWVNQRFDKIKHEHTWDNIFDQYRHIMQSMVQEKANVL